ncbi:MAG: hypothetical protein J5372_00585 [Lachnospiraceae bacterium]|nr:hypothetical protein [Lachnospiraceae bacterium]
MGTNKLDGVTFNKLYDVFGEKVASDILNEVNEGKVKAETVEKYMFTDETKEEYAKRLREE